MLPLKVGINLMTSLGAEAHGTTRDSGDTSVTKDFSAKDGCLGALEVTNDIHLPFPHLAVCGVVHLATCVLHDGWCTATRCGADMLDNLARDRGTNCTTRAHRDRKSTTDAAETSARLGTGIPPENVRSVVRSTTGCCQRSSRSGMQARLGEGERRPGMESSTR